MAFFLLGVFATNAGETNTGAMNASVVNAGGAASPGSDHRYATTAAECVNVLSSQWPAGKLSPLTVRSWHLAILP